jgi:hypothetical protein
MGTKVLSTAFNDTNKIRAYAHCAKNSVRRSGTCDGKLLLTVRCLNHARFNMFSGRDHSAPDQPGRHQHEPHLRDEPRRARPERKEEGERDVRRPHHPCRARRSSSHAHETGVPSDSQGQEPAEPAAAAERQRPGNRRRRGDPGAGARAGGGDAAHNRGPLLYRVCSRPQLLRSCVPVARVFVWIFFSLSRCASRRLGKSVRVNGEACSSLPIVREV